MTVAEMSSMITGRIPVVSADFSSENVIEAINQAKHALHAKRPEAFMTSALSYAEPADYTLTTDTIDMWPRFKAAMVYYALHWLYLKRAKDPKTQSEADRYLDLFRKEI